MFLEGVISGYYGGKRGREVLVLVSVGRGGCFYFVEELGDLVFDLGFVVWGVLGFIFVKRSGFGGEFRFMAVVVVVVLGVFLENSSGVKELFFLEWFYFFK